MKTKSFSILVLCLAFACGKDDPQPSVTETPLSTYLQSKSGLNFETYDDGTTYNVGYEFKTNGGIKVTELGLTTVSAGNYGVQLYEVDSIAGTGTLVAEATVAISASEATAKTFKYTKVATPLSLKKGYYRVVYSSVDFYRLPVQAGHALPVAATGSVIKIIQGVFGDDSSFPNQGTDRIYLADLKFKYNK